jgi:transposase InsO family protein
VTVASIADDLESLHHSMGNDSVGVVPPANEQPHRARSGNEGPLSLSHESQRQQLNNKLLVALADNAAITGFCSLPSSTVVLEIDKSKAHSLYRRQYPIADRLWRLADVVIQRWLAEGRIAVASPNCPFNLPLTIAPKKDENGKMTGIRVCLDTRSLNAILVINDRHPLPLMRELLSSFMGCSLFGEFDLSEAYLQLLLDENSRQYTAFTWRGQQYWFVGVPFGINFIPSFFQRTLARLLNDFAFVEPFFDNLPFASHSWEEHEQHALLIITRLTSANLKIKPSSVNVGNTRMKCLGYVVSVHGLGNDPDKVQAIVDCPRPATSEAMQRFLGMVTFVRFNTRHVGELTASLEAVKFQRVIEWSSELESAFTAVKAAITSSPLLRFPDFSFRFSVATDASNVGVGAVLFQPLSEDPAEYITPHNIVAIISRKLTPAEQRYPAYKKELLGVVYALRRFHTYIWGRRIIIITDHRPLLYILSSALLSPALQQWLDVILDYDFEIVHRPGVLHVLPDQLSRMYLEYYDFNPASQSWGVPQLARPVSSVIPTADDTVLASLPVSPSASSSSMGEGAPFVATLSELNEADAAVAAPPLPASHQAVNLAIELERRGKRAPPDLEREGLITAAHLFGHFGIKAVYHKLFNDNYWWPKMREQIATVIENCEACSRFNVIKAGFHPARAITASGPGEHLQIDLATHLPKSSDGHVALLVVVCVFSGFVLLRPLKNQEMETVARKLWKIFCTIGIPKILQSDNGREFVNGVLHALVRLTGIDQRVISPYNPRADGKVERTVGSTMMIIKKLLHGTNAHWSLFVPFAQLTFNDKVSSLTTSSPFCLMFGRKLNALRDYSTSSLDPRPVSLDSWKEHQEKILSLIYPALSEKIKFSKDKLVTTLNKHRRQLLPASIPNGSTAYIIDPTRNDKFEPKYLGPYTVVRRAHNGAYVLKDGTGDLLDRHVPVDQLKILTRAHAPANDEYEIVKLLDHRGTPGNYEFKIQWKGYERPTWEPESNIVDTRCIRDYWAAHPPASASVAARPLRSSRK